MPETSDKCLTHGTLHLKKLDDAPLPQISAVDAPNIGELIFISVEM